MEIQETKHKKNKSLFHDVPKQFVATHVKRNGQGLTEVQKRIRRQILRNNMYEEIIDNTAQQDQQKLKKAIESRKSAFSNYVLKNRNN